jgi:glycosyltransferase involved in cell wall biosynthesis
MKIIVVNYRYFLSGGPERYLFNITEVLERNGHTVIPFSIQHNKNKPTPWEPYFMSPIGTGNEVYANEYKKTSLSTLSKVMGRMLYSFEAKRKLKKLIRDTRPDLVYVLYYQNKMSSSVIDAAYEMKVPVVQRISDFGHICANNIFYIYQRNEVCERCLHGSRINAVKYKCVGNSRASSLLKVLALKIQDFRHTTRKISGFIIPAEFTAGRFREFGIPAEKIHCIPTFFNSTNESSTGITYGDFFLYVGRVDPDKGILTMLKAFVLTGYKLVIVGSSIEGYDDKMKEYLAGKKHQVTFLGKLDFPAIRPYLESCLCTLCPSECYDNMPNSVLESYACRKAVIVSRLGALTDLVPDHQTGLQFRVADPADLAEKLIYMNDHREQAAAYGNAGRNKLETEFSELFHYNQLMEVFNKVKSEYN